MSSLSSLLAMAALALLAGCASGPRTAHDGAPSNPPGNLSSVPDAEPRVEALRGSGGTSKPYTVSGRAYQPITDDRPLRESGLASWYGRQFHGQSTASGEPYDMYAMTAAHKTLPLPSYVRVRNPANGREAIVRVNDRGPFHDGRVIDLSYTAALKLDVLRGVAPVEIERITNDDIRTGAWRRDGSTLLAATGAIGGVRSAASSGADGARGTAGAFTTPVATSTLVPGSNANDSSDSNKASDAGSTSNVRASDAVMVPSAWTTPVAATPAQSRPGTLLAQAPAATPSATDAGSSSSPAMSAPPPPRFRDMESSDLPPMAPVSPAPPAAPASPTSPFSAGPPPSSSGSAGSSAAMPRANDSAGFWVQLGAFRERESADSVLEKTGRDASEFSSRLRVLSEAGTHRVQVGPFASREAANSASAQLRESTKGSPIVIERR